MPRFLKVQRQEFLTRYFHWTPDEHVLILGPTGSGKTQLLLDALRVKARPTNPALLFAMKPKDETLDEYAEANNFRETRIWPPPPTPWKKKPNGFIVKPTIIPKDIAATRRNQESVFQEAILDSYAKGRRILAADETYSLTNELGLGDELVTVWTKGRSMRCSLWAASQRPAYIPTWAYSQSTHIFIAFDPDKRSRKRYEEISGVDPDLIRTGTDALGEWEWFYIKVAGRRSTMCIVSA